MCVSGRAVVFTPPPLFLYVFFSMLHVALVRPVSEDDKSPLPAGGRGSRRSSRGHRSNHSRTAPTSGSKRCAFFDHAVSRAWGDEKFNYLED